MKKEILVLDFDTQETVSIIVDSEPESIEETIEEYGINSNNCSWTIRDFQPKRKTLVYLHVKNNNKNRTTIKPTFAETIFCDSCQTRSTDERRFTFTKNKTLCNYCD